jgi:uncharacterized SAM-binding protein YcdF (DUF218 family)
MISQPRRKVITEFRVMVTLAAAFAVGFFLSMNSFKSAHISTDSSIPVEAIVIPGGGSQRGKAPEDLPAYVIARLNAALDYYAYLRQHGHTTNLVFIVLSFGTVHRPNYVNQDGWVVSEATSEALYLLHEAKRRSININAEDILRENLSLDTIGNAFFTRILHCDVAGYRRLHVITSHFHLARTRAIFEFIFGCVPTFKPYILSFQGTPNIVDGEALAVREEREKKSLQEFHEMLKREFDMVLPNRQDEDSSATFAPRNNVKLRDVHHFVFSKHKAYVTREELVPLSAAEASDKGSLPAQNDQQQPGANETSMKDAPPTASRAALLDTY